MPRGCLSDEILDQGLGAAEGALLGPSVRAEARLIAPEEEELVAERVVEILLVDLDESLLEHLLPNPPAG